jgi:hypothetical protein
MSSFRDRFLRTFGSSPARPTATATSPPGG